MPSTNKITEGIMIVPDNDDFLEIMMQLQEAYNNTHGHTGCDVDED